jgi:sodium/potassium-transporting ATPase subunit alpha
VLFRIPLPLTVIQILAVDLGTDMLPALAVGAEPPHPEVMTRPPRRHSQRLLDRPTLARAYLFLGPLQALVAMTMFSLVLWRGGWRWGAALGHTDPLYLQATTACFTGIVVCQVVNLFLCRDPVRPALSRGLRGNRLLAVGLASEIALLLAIVYTPLGNRLVGTAPLPAWVWLTCIPLALAMGLAEEVRKALVRRGRRLTNRLPADAPHPGDRGPRRTR